MYAKTFIAHASRGRLTSAATAKTYPYDRYVCHLCKSALVFHPEWGTNRPWFEHTENTLTENGHKHCPYVVTEPEEMRLILRLRRLVTDVHPIVRQADWYCMECDKHYHGERYCLSCRTGTNSAEVPARLTLLWTPGAEDVTCV
jgi:hypothetical protein